jgi:CO/xanthine dehydrogenase FAD-binding subunit
MPSVTAAAIEQVDVVVPRSAEEAIASFGDGSGVTVLGGGTILMPEITARRLRPERVMLMARAGLDQVVTDNGRLRIGANVRIEQLLDAPEPLASAARFVADPEIRGQATLGGNLCSRPGPDYPRGDLQAPLISLGASVRSAGAGGARDEAVEDFLTGDPTSRLVLDVELDASRSGAFASVRRPHAHAYTILAVSGSVASDGSDLRLAAAGAGPHGVRLRSAEAAGFEGDPKRALDDVTLVDDALASAWYRERMLPVLVSRVLVKLKEGR